MQTTHVCLVHGDFSPKNVLVGDGIWVIDFEVAHFGDPVFDVAYMLNHLFSSSSTCSSALPLLRACPILGGVCRAVPEESPPRLAYVSRHVGVLMVARVDGKSPGRVPHPRGEDSRPQDRFAAAARATGLTG